MVQPVNPYSIFLSNQDGDHLEELTDAQLSSVKWSLNGIGEINFTMSQDDERVDHPLLGIHEVQVISPSYPYAWQGPILKCGNVPGIASFTAYTVEQYFLGRFVLNASLVYTSMDQFSIAAAVVNAMQAGTDQDRNIVPATVPLSGRVRSRTYDRWDHPNAWDILSEFPTLADAFGNSTGFDHAVLVYKDGRREWTPFYPGRGTVRDEPVLEWNRNVTDFSVPEDATNLANRTYCTGGSNGDIKFENNFRDAATATQYGEWQQIIEAGQQRDVAVLLEKAQDYTTKHKYPIVFPDITAVEVPDTLLGVLDVGDWLPVRIKRGRVNIADHFRIQSITWRPGPGNMKLDFAEPVSS